jgi:hypothetical protein
MLRWIPYATPAIAPHRWESRAKILQEYLDSLPPEELLHVRPDYYALTRGGNLGVPAGNPDEMHVL